MRRLIISIWLCGPLLLIANVSKSPAHQSSQQQGNSAQEPKIRTQVNEVTTPVTITDKEGNFILDIPEKDFHVFDNGVEQHIDRWGVESQRLDIALVIESSGHVSMMAPTIRKSGIIVTQMVMAVSGEAAVVSYGDTVDVRESFTQDHEAIETSIANLKFNDDGMDLYDAMWQAALLLEKRPSDSRRVMLVLGEAQDHGSTHKLGEILQQAQLANISIYAIGLSSTIADLRADSENGSTSQSSPYPSGVQPVPSAPGMPQGVNEGGVGGGDFLYAAVWLVERATNQKKNHALQAAVSSTGGEYLHPKKDRAIQTALNQIGNELHSQYVLSYQLQGPAVPGIHQIKVTVSRPQVIVRARLGYYLRANPAN
jgi:VWFA-related protein